MAKLALLLLMALAEAHLDLEALALEDDDECQGDCAANLLQVKGSVIEEEVCVEWKQCPENTKYYMGKPCDANSRVCTRYGKPQKRQCMKWVNCKNSCYCAQWAKLLEESEVVKESEAPPTELEEPELVVQVDAEPEKVA
ncbi:unnamed protein product [Effrenium voratum]|nr:unnamed protein product [Effrenium voratum]